MAQELRLLETVQTVLLVHAIYYYLIHKSGDFSAALSIVW